MSKRPASLALAITTAAFLGVLTGMGLLIDSGFEITQMRNAFIASPGSDDDFNWLPGRPPAGFLRDDGPPPNDFEEAARRVLDPLPQEASELERALVLARHLASGPGPGPGVKSSTREAYRTILTERRGYCSDYTQVLNGLGYAAEIPIREWGMSFDDYSGYGHGFSEVYDRALSKWVFVDSFYSMYVVDAVDGVPLSVLELRERLSAGEGTGSLRVQPIVPGKFGFKSPEKALEYYRKGADGFFLYFGNNVFSYDAHPVVSALSGVSRALEETAGILLGIRPGIRLVQTASNGASIERLSSRRRIFSLLAALAVALVLALSLEIRTLSRRRPSPLAA